MGHYRSERSHGHTGMGIMYQRVEAAYEDPEASKYIWGTAFHWYNGWVFWNLILDQDNGPRHAGGLHGTNIVNADLASGKLTFNPPHYVFGHFSRFIKPGAKRIPCTLSSNGFIATAFINPGGGIAVVIQNLKDVEQMGQMCIEGKVIKFTSPANGLITMIL